eukprot:TRINITY_DN2846_c0_g2_i1.p1 TRINITY_DN2846_c0_g2~~TRINITY_DN2846_c0_g2_i1.p1  ORF type:complete len:916 (-),score=339.10 TRINITY_DN2846_c0_g2_i1:692-3301(-)
MSSDKESNGNPLDRSNNNGDPADGNMANSLDSRPPPPSLPPTHPDPLSLFKNPLFNPALLSLNPSLYAVQLAHLQAAQLLSQASSRAGQEEASRKRKMSEDNSESAGAKRSTSPPSLKESPLDLTKDHGKPFPPAPGLFFNPFLGQQQQQQAQRLEASALLKGNNPLERMSEIVKGPPSRDGGSFGARGGGGASGPRHSAWQSQWINRGPENSKDIFKCVWCKDAFSSLQDLTDHMKETKHFGPQIPPPSPPPSSLHTSSRVSPTSAPRQVHKHLSNTPASPKSRDILKEQLPMPRKLVRGQDVWLGRGEMQTRDILKCMWCGQSFRSLDLMTKHMQETKHYTKVISQEQLSSWKSGEPPPSGSPTPPSNATPSPQVNSVLTCKVCESSFSSLRELSDHMVKSNHGEPKIAHNPSPAASSSPLVVTSPPPTAKEKRKKSLPVRKLLELERAQQELIISGGKSSSDEGRISCEKCSEKIPVSLFASHIHLCIGSPDSLRRPPSSSAASTPPSVSPPSPSSKGHEETENEKATGNQPKSILGSLEKMVQSNFGGASKRVVKAPEGGSLSILQRLGIDEGSSSDFSRPEAQMFRPHPFLLGGKLSSASRSDSSECSSPDRSSSKNAPEKLLFPGGDEEHPLKTEEQTRGSPLPPSSPAPSQKSLNESIREEPERNTSLVDKHMEETSKTEEDSGPSKKKNPLAALQMLCDKTEKPKTQSLNSGPLGGGGFYPTPSSSSHLLLPPHSTTTSASLYSDPGAILAFSWACNQAIVNDSLLKCPFCETPFISKGAYRHHLSKVHFLKDDKGGGGGTPPPPPLPGGGEKSPSPLSEAQASSSGGSPLAENSAKAENATSKFQKYSQLAKQLSCSSQP